MLAWVMLNLKKVIINSFKHCKLTVETDVTEDLLIHCLKPNQPCVVSLDQLNRLYYVVLQENQDNSETY